MRGQKCCIYLCTFFVDPLVYFAFLFFNETVITRAQGPVVVIAKRKRRRRGKKKGYIYIHTTFCQVNK